MTYSTPDFADDQVKPMPSIRVFVFPLVIFFLLVAAMLYRSGAFAGKHAHELPPQFSSRIAVADAIEQADEIGVPLLVMFSASWCGPCKMMKAGPLRSDAVQSWLETTGSALYVDVDEQPDDANAYSVRAMPTFVLFENGRELKRIVGGMDAKSLVEWLNTL